MGRAHGDARRDRGAPRRLRRGELVDRARDYLGEWTADTSSQGPAAAQVFTISESDETTTRSDSVANSNNFDDYCRSTFPGVPPVTYFTVTTTDSGVFGGCVSAKTGGHIYTWNTGQVWYSHYTTVKGEPVLKGDLVTGVGPSHYSFTAHHPAVDFLTHVKFTQVLGKASRHLAELTTVTGVGEFRLDRASHACLAIGLVSGHGALKVKSVKIDPPNTVELDNLTVKPIAAQSDATSDYECVDGQTIRHAAVAVAKSDPHEKDACPVGATGRLWLIDGDATHTEDKFKLDIPKCDVDLVFAKSKVKKGSKNTVAVAMALNEKGY